MFLRLVYAACCLQLQRECTRKMVSWMPLSVGKTCLVVPPKLRCEYAAQWRSFSARLTTSVAAICTESLGISIRYEIRSSTDQQTMFPKEYIKAVTWQSNML